jgi:4-nitrophenyl phosphatase
MMKKYKGFLIDLDGTVYRGTEIIAEAVTFVKELERRNLPYLFVTNNSTKQPAKVAETLVEMGVPATADHVFTTSMATANFIYDEKADAKVYVIGEDGIRYSLKEKGFEIVEKDADYVVIGLDRSVSYEKLVGATLNVHSGARFIATNGDTALVTERGLLPGNGSIVSVVTVATGVQPVFIGKPESIIMEQALEVLGTSKEETLMIGDNYHTDILAGINAGIDSLLVHTGVTMKEHLKDIEVQPTYALSSLAEWVFDEE